MKLGKWNGLKCKTYFVHINVAKKYSKNGTVPIADGVRCDGRKEIKRIIDHLKGTVHAESQ